MQVEGNGERKKDEPPTRRDFKILESDLSMYRFFLLEKNSSEGSSHLHIKLMNVDERESRERERL